MRYSRLCHFQLRCELTDIPFAIEQNGNNAQARRVAQGAEQVSQVSGGIFFEYHSNYMNDCSIIHDYSIEKENCQTTVLVLSIHNLMVLVYGGDLSCAENMNSVDLSVPQSQNPMGREKTL